jgi:4-hydroxy-2-oxoheptanedioate aldolase
VIRLTTIAIKTLIGLSMPAPHNFLKEQLASGDVLLGCWVAFANDYAIEITANAGFDWLLIDGEHAPNNLLTTIAQLRVVQSSPSQAMVRLPDDDPVKIKKFLDIGVQNLLIPMIESAEQAKNCLRACFYPPHGFRGVGSSIARASQFSAIPDYLETANEQICIMLQVESRKGIEALDDILALNDLDAVFIGPSDLAADMGYLGKPQHPEVKKVVFEAIGKIRAAGKAAGVLALSSDFIQECKDAEANFIGVAMDVTAYSQTIRALAKAYR